jgi:hypothetical protein
MFTRRHLLAALGAIAAAARAAIARANTARDFMSVFDCPLLT